MEKLDAFVKKNMTLLVILFLIIGFLFGLFVNKESVSFLRKLVIPSAFIMLWAMMINMDITKFINAIRYPRELLIGTVMSLVIAPLIMFPIALLVTKNPRIFSGLILAGLVPPGGFITYWTGILMADIALAVAIQLVTFIVSLFWIPYGMKLAVGKRINIKVLTLFIKILILIVGPFILAIGSRVLILKLWGEKGLKKLTPSLHFISSLMALFLVFSGVSLKAKFIYIHPGLIIFPALGALFYYLLMFPFSYIVAKKVFSLPYEKAIPVVYGASTKNLSIAMGLAIAAFGPLALMGVVSAIIFQMPLASIWYKVFENMRIKHETMGKAIVEEAEEILEEIEEDVEEIV